MIATTRAALLRGTITTNALGDEIDDNSTPLRLYSDWTEQRRNLVPNPQMRTAATNWASSSVGATMGRVAIADLPDFSFAFGTPSANQGITNAGRIYFAAVPVVIGAGYCLSAWVYFTGTLVDFRVRGDAAAGVGTIQANMQLSGAPGWRYISLPFVAVESMARLSFAFSGSGSVAGTAALVTGAVIEPGLIPGAYVDGSTNPGGELERTRWLGLEDASASVLEMRELLADFSDFPIAITDTSGHEFDEASNAWRYVRKYTGRVSTRIPVQAGDRIRDNIDGAIYAVGEVNPTRRSVSGRSSVTMTLKRTAPTP